MQTIELSELELLTESENPVIVDVREDFEYQMVMFQEPKIFH